MGLSAKSLSAWIPVVICKLTKAIIASKHIEQKPYLHKCGFCYQLKLMLLLKLEVHSLFRTLP